MEDCARPADFTRYTADVVYYGAVVLSKTGLGQTVPYTDLRAASASAMGRFAGYGVERSRGPVQHSPPDDSYVVYIDVV